MEFRKIFKTDEDYQKVKVTLGNAADEFEKEFEAIKDIDVIPMHRFNEVVQERNDSKKNYEEVNKKLEKLSKESLSPEDAKKKQDEIIAEYQKKVDDANKKYNDLRRDGAIKEALAAAGAKHSTLLIKEFDMEKISDKDGKFEGIDDQIKILKETYKDLFPASEEGNNQNNPNIYQGIKNQPLMSGANSIREKFSNAFWGDNPPPKN